MYVVRRGDHWWFRKAIPVDLVDVLGIAEVRRSLRTRSAHEARRRALDVLVRVEEVYAVLRSERPMRPARDVALALLDEALRTDSGTPAAFEGNGQLFHEAAGVLRRTGDGDRSVGRRTGTAGSAEDPEAEPISLVRADDALRMLRGETPKAEENKIAVAILEAVARMSLGRLSDTNQGARDLDVALSALSVLREGAAAPEPGARHRPRGRSAPTRRPWQSRSRRNRRCRAARGFGAAGCRRARFHSWVGNIRAARCQRRIVPA